jgi:translation elongation factor EF-G
MKAYTYKEFADKELVESEIPADMMDQVKKYRSLLIENAVAEDETILEKYFEVGEEGLLKTKSNKLFVQVYLVVSSLQ